MSRRPIVDGLFTLPEDGPPRLVVSQCRRCDARTFPPRARCQACSGEDVALAEAPAEGTVYAWTVVRELGGPRPDFEPYVVAQVDLGPGLRVQGIVDAAPGAVQVGTRVRTGVVRPPGPDLDEDVVTYCFVPLAGGAA